MAHSALLYAFLFSGTSLGGTDLFPEDVEIVLSGLEHARDGKAVHIDVRILNAAARARTVPLPESVEAELDTSGTKRHVRLARADEGPPDLVIPAGGFVRARYVLAPDEEDRSGTAILSVPAWQSPPVALLPAQVPVAPTFATIGVAEPESASPPVGKPAAPPVDRTNGNAFLANLSAYEPLYAVYGPGTNTAARIQISFKYRLFGSRDRSALGDSWRDGLHFAYSQRMFWDLAAESSPFRNIDYLPEIFYLAPSIPVADGMALSGQIGLRHESNGRAGQLSRSLNTLYAASLAGLDLGPGRRLLIGPRLSLPVGDKSDNPDIFKYRGHLSLIMEIGEDNGLRLSTATRMNLSTGRGAVSAGLSYPLDRLWRAGPDLYLFSQSFIGYGENLLDYNRRDTRLRLGFAIVR